MEIKGRPARSALLLSALALASACHKTPDAPPTPKPVGPEEPGLVLMDQGWSADTRETAWFSSFGSQLMPYRWLALLEKPDSTERFASDTNLGRLGFLPAPASAKNPGGYPVGFAPTKGSDGQSWVGLGCAACHTGEVHYQGKELRIDGGPGLLDFTHFEAELIASLSATATDPEKFDRFANALGATGNARLALQNQLIRLTQIIDTTHRINETDIDYGHGRLDAFGQIFNAVAVTSLGIPENARPPDAPVSFPALWSASHLDVVQWNGSAPNAGPGPLLQNVTTALAVYGTVDLHKGPLGGYPSGVNFSDLGAIQDRFYQLQSPQWPNAIFGTPDATRVARGATIYAAQCQSCHALSDRSDRKRQLPTTLVPLQDIGTDPRMVQNFLRGEVKTGVLQGRKQALLAGPVFGPKARSIDVVVHAAIGATMRHPLAAVKDAVVGYHRTIKAGIDQHPNHYKARPLDGIWASAPYLHNGSVPNLASLLLPPAQRPTAFDVGQREYDPVGVGYVLKAEGAPASAFDTALTGNSNAGHVYGTTLDAAARADLLEYLKTL